MYNGTVHCCSISAIDRMACLYSQQPVPPPPIVCVFDKQTFSQSQNRLLNKLILLFYSSNKTGNSIGLQLGVSVLTLCEALEWGAFQLVHWLKRSMMVAYTSSQRWSQLMQRRRISTHPSSSRMTDD